MVSAEPVIAAAGSAQALVTHNTLSAAAGRRSSEGSSSLTRRPRVRRANSRRDEDSSSDFLTTSDDISSGQLFVQIPQGETRLSSSPKSLNALESGAPPRPPRSPRRLQTAPVLDDKETNLDQQRLSRQRTRSIDPTTRRPVIEDIRGRQTRSDDGDHIRAQRSRGLSLPRHAFRNNSLSDSSEQPSPLTPNAFNDIPLIPVFAQNRRFRHQPRDSGVTQQSTVSSSVYPKSTSTEGSYSSPPSLPAQDMDDRHIITVDPGDESQLDALHEMDADEVSYRLRLLMQNNYYLPPAHSKPFSEIPSVDTPKKSPIKSSSPTFLDIFKVVKKKSTISPDNNAAPANSPPILRTTSDSSTLSGLLNPQRNAPPMAHLRASRSLPQTRQESKGRVVVVRERMDDLATIAKQVEQEIKARENERQQNASGTSQSDSLLVQFVDPTDSVDIPLVPSNEFFGPHAALLRGMGIDSSLGAALLADQLPPSSPGSSSAECADTAWRRAILHAAVDHSLNSSSTQTPARSTTSSGRPQAFDLSSAAATSASPSMLSPSIASPASSHPPLPSMSATETVPPRNTEPSILDKKPIIGQPILSRIIDEVRKLDSSSPASNDGPPDERGRPNQPAVDKGKTHGLNVAPEPARASSPLVPTFPLRPPPRRPSQTPLNSSGSGSDNVREVKEQNDESLLEAEASHLQAEQEPPLRLSDAYESHIGLSDAFDELTPPASQHNSVAVSAVKPGTIGSFTASKSLSTTSGSHYSDDEDGSNAFHTPHEQTLASIFAESRPSLGSVSVPRKSYDSSQPSPTTSAFRDAHDRSQYTGSNANLSDLNTLGGNSRAPSHISVPNDPRFAVVSPPPRVSSRFARNSDADYPHHPRQSEQDEPGTPTALHVPRLTVHDLLASESRASPYTASPISFFDAVEMQSRHDDEESSDSENDEEGAEEAAPPDIRDNASIISSNLGGRHSDSVSLLGSDPRTGSTHSLVHDPRLALGALMQQRNASSPQLGSRTASSERDTERWRAISNVPRSSSRPTFWHKKHGKRPELFPNPPRVSESTADYLKHEAAKEALIGGKRPHTAGSRIAGKEGHSSKERQDTPDPSVRRLDGLLAEHIEKEKEVLKRITTNLSKSSSST